MGLTVAGAVGAGCNYAPPKPPIPPRSVLSGPLPNQSGRPTVSNVVDDPNSEKPNTELDPETVKRREVILANVIKLMRDAYKNPGGHNFEHATENLNELFEQGTTPADYAPTPDSRDFLLRKIYELSKQDPTPIVKSLSSPKFAIRDARHIEDCMLYHAVATRIAGEGDDLTRVRRIFDWMVRNVQLVPAESLSGPGMSQAQARPADVLFRGMATENGSWSERGWLFMSLCRQIGVDAGILTFSPRRPMTMTAANAAPPLVSWIMAAIVDDKPYLFDQRIGLEIPSVDGSGVATLNDVAAHPEILERLDLPGQSNLGVTASDIAGSPTKIGVLLDSSIGYLSPRMRLLQGQLRGEYRTILFRDPAEQAKHFAKALGPRYGGSFLWSLPIQVEDLLFSNPDFVAATQASLRFFDNKYPLLYARTMQLRGELVDSTNRYLTLRFAEKPVTADGKEDPIPPEVQKALDIYATYFLAQIALDRGNTDLAEYTYRKMLDLVPEPGPGRYFFYMLRWGALNNLGRICEAKGDLAGAIAFYTEGDSTNGMVTPQRHGNLLRARQLVWNNPLSEPTAPLPPAPTIPAALESAGLPTKAGVQGNPSVTASPVSP